MQKMETHLHIANENIEKMHDIETQLHDVKEALANNLLEKDVCNSILSSISSQNEFLGAF